MRCKWTQLMARGRFDMFVATSLASNRFIYASMFWLYLTSYIVTSLSLQALYCVPDPDPGSQAWVLLERGLDLSVTAFSTHSFPRIPRMRSASVDLRLLPFPFDRIVHYLAHPIGTCLTPYSIGKTGQRVRCRHDFCSYDGGGGSSTHSRPLPGTDLLETEPRREVSWRWQQRRRLDPDRRRFAG